MQHQEIHERAAGVIQPDTLLASQYFDRIRRRSDLTGEQRLMCAIIEDAIDVYLKHAAARTTLHEKLFAEAEAWIETEDRGWIFSFETICEYLGLEPSHVRGGLRRYKARVRDAADEAALPPVDPAVPEFDEAERRRAGNE